MRLIWLLKIRHHFVRENGLAGETEMNLILLQPGVKHFI